MTYLRTTRGAKQQENRPLSSSVIICAYTEERWNDLVEAVASIEAQTAMPQELILAIDHNPGLYERARRQFPRALVIQNQLEKGLSGARNSAIEVAGGEVIAFMDEDALAEPNWFACLLEGYADPSVMGVGGAIDPLWLAGCPAWFPREFDWVVGCTYRGMPESPAYVRNLIGANMSLRRQVLDELGGFRSGLGRVNTLPLGCEETELCIRALQRWPGRKFLYDPAARVRHRVPAKRSTLRYFTSRCFAEGISKAAVSRLVGSGDGLSSERQYTLRTLPAGFAQGLKDALTGKWAGLGRSAAILTGLGITTLGYLKGNITNRKGDGERVFPFSLRFKAGQGPGKKSSPPHSPSPETSKPVSGEGEAPEQAIVMVAERHPLSRIGVGAPILERGLGGEDGSFPSSRLHLLIVTPLFTPHTGGIENHVHEVSRRLAAKNVDVTVLTTDVSGKLPKSEWMDGFQVVRVPAWQVKGDFLFSPGIYQAIRQGHWDIVHLQSYHTFVAPLAMAAALRSRIPYVVTFHGGGHSSWLRNQIRPLQRVLLGPFFRRAPRLIATASFEIDQYGRELNLPAERFALIPNGGNLPKAETMLQDRDGSLIASVGRLERYKGHHRLVAAMPFIIKALPDARLWIAGSGPEEARLCHQIEQLGVQEQVEIRSIPLADRQAMAKELSKASLFALMSEFETHPMAVLEALALGVPALVANTSGLSELAEKGLAHSIPLNSSSEEIAQSVVDLLNHFQPPPAVHLPTWDDCAQELYKLYCEIIG